MRNHGTKNKYDIEKCRCDLCKKAVRDYNMRRRALRKEREPFLPIGPLWEKMTHHDQQRYTHFYNAHKDTGIRLYAADRWCIRFGLHPWSVYGDLWFEQAWKEMADEQG